jgi:DeoR/GlpR family transcriptional regulator of sugar metabolism
MSNESVEIRRKKIIERLNSEDKVYVKALAEEFSVAMETIRRDLDYLDGERQLKKIFGGAVKLKNNRLELLHKERGLYNLEIKQKIALTASELIEDDDTIAILGGSTTEQMTPYLTDKRNLTIVTNSLPIAFGLLHYEEEGRFDGRVVLLGGETSSASMSASGYFTEEMLSKLSFNRAFFSCGGFAPDSISTYLYEHIKLSKILIEKSDLNVLLADTSKMNVNHLYSFASLRDINVVVCDSAIPEQWVNEIDLYQLQWLVANKQQNKNSKT